MRGKRACLPRIGKVRVIVLSGALICTLAGGCRKSAAPTPGSSTSQQSADNGSRPSVADELFDFKRHPRKSMIKPLEVSTLSETEKKYGRAP